MTALVELVAALEIDIENDNFTVLGSNGIAVGFIIKRCGSLTARHVRKNISGRWNRFDPRSLSNGERKSLTRKMYADKVTQSDISKLLNVSRSTVSNDVDSTGRMSR